jgi:hypothetical protein
MVYSFFQFSSYFCDFFFHSIELIFNYHFSIFLSLILLYNWFFFLGFIIQLYTIFSFIVLIV